MAAAVEYDNSAGWPVRPASHRPPRQDRTHSCHSTGGGNGSGGSSSITAAADALVGPDDRGRRALMEVARVADRHVFAVMCVRLDAPDGVPLSSASRLAPRLGQPSGESKPTPTAGDLPTCAVRPCMTCTCGCQHECDGGALTKDEDAEGRLWGHEDAGAEEGVDFVFGRASHLPSDSSTSEGSGSHGGNGSSSGCSTSTSSSIDGGLGPDGALLDQQGMQKLRQQPQQQQQQQEAMSMATAAFAQGMLLRSSSTSAAMTNRPRWRTRSGSGDLSASSTLRSVSLPTGSGGGGGSSGTTASGLVLSSPSYRVMLSSQGALGGASREGSPANALLWAAEVRLDRARRAREGKLDMEKGVRA